MSAISKPTPEELAPLLAEATNNGHISEETWRERLAAGIVRVLQKDPLQYRCYGPYWWLVKACLLEQGIARFGTTIDAEWHEKLDYGDPTTNLLAAFAYYSYAFDQGLIRSSGHSVVLEDGEGMEYVLVDEEMEQLAVGGM